MSLLVERAPRTIAPYVSNGAKGNAVFGAELPRALFAAGSDFLDLLGSKLGGRMCLARLKAGPIASLGYHICRVVFRIPEKQMVWSDAGRIIAVMADKEPGRYWPTVKFPGDAARSDWRAVSSSAPDSAAAMFVKATFPQPTSVSLLDLFPEPDFKRNAMPAAAAFIDISASVVPVNIGKWRALGAARSLVSIFGDACLLAATAVAKAIRDFARGAVCGTIGSHGVTPIQLFCAALPAVDSSAGALCCPHYTTGEAA